MDGESLPSSKTMQEHQANEAYTAGTWALVDVDVSKLSGKAVEARIT